jgi:hypothetical protein
MGSINAGTGLRFATGLHEILENEMRIISWLSAVLDVSLVTSKRCEPENRMLSDPYANSANVVSGLGTSFEEGKIFSRSSELAALQSRRRKLLKSIEPKGGTTAEGIVERAQMVGVNAVAWGSFPLDIERSAIKAKNKRLVFI